MVAAVHVVAARVGVGLAGILVLAACDLSLAATERATTGSGAEPDDGATPDPDRVDRRVMQAYLECLDGCTAGIESDHATCRLACASASLDDVPDLSAGAKTCMLPCLETLARCSIGCDTTPTPPDGEDACMLLCESAASSCLSYCVEQSG
jgi:hypothetical protein